MRENLNRSCDRLEEIKVICTNAVVDVIFFEVLRESSPNPIQRTIYTSPKSLTACPAEHSSVQALLPSAALEIAPSLITMSCLLFSLCFFFLWPGVLSDGGELNVNLQKMKKADTWPAALQGRNAKVDPMTLEGMQKKIMLERFQNEVRVFGGGIGVSSRA